MGAAKQAITVKRTPALTAEVRRLFVAELLEYGGWELGATFDRIADATGLTHQQAAEAVFAPSADTWRRQLALR